MAYNLNDYGNCSSDYKGTGVRACDIVQFGDATGIIPFVKGFSKPITDGAVDFDLTAYLTEVKGLRAFPLLGIYDFAQNTPENEKNTSSTGVLTEIRAGKPQFSFMYDKGGCFHKALFDKRGKGKWDFAITFETGFLMATNADGTKLKGFDGGMLSVETFKLVQGTDPQMSTATLQLLDAIEFNERFVFIPYEVAGDIGDVNGVIETSITVDAITAGTTFTASINSGCNSGDSILGLDEITNFALLGTQASATTISAVSINATTGKYEFTVTPTLVSTDTVQIKLNDGTYNVVEDSDGNLFKGTSNTVVVS